MNDSASQNDYFIGLSVTYHDPAVAIVDSSRKLLFAEATERHLQLKRALNCEPDGLYRIVDLLGNTASVRSGFLLLATGVESGLSTSISARRPATLRHRAFCAHDSASGQPFSKNTNCFICLPARGRRCHRVESTFLGCCARPSLDATALHGF